MNFEVRQIPARLECSTFKPNKQKEPYPIEEGAYQVVLGVKNLPANAGDLSDAGLIPGSGRSPEGNGSPLQYSCLENSMDRRA